MTAPSPLPQRQDWRFPQPYNARGLGLVLVAIVALLVTGARVEIDRMLVLSGDGLLAAVGLKKDSQVAKGFATIGQQLFPLVIAERTETSRIENFDPAHLPALARLETVESTVETLNPDTLQIDRSVERVHYMVEPFGYLRHVALKLVETLEIAFWGTTLAIVLAVPLAILGARNLTPHPFVYFASRSIVSFLRSVPELISALFLVLAYGFGPIAGVLALAFHAAGFLGKFYAEDIENADPKAQEALSAIGASRLKVLVYAILPQVAPQYIAYTLYVLDRNVRMATVIGLVGAGGIGQELKGRYDMYNYGHVATILLAIFLLVVALDQISIRLRRHLID